MDVTVIGGGIIGCTIAWRLAQRGARVTILEAGRLGAQASWAGAGMLAPGGEVTGDSPWALRSVESLKMYPAFVRELEEASGVPIDFRACGAFELAYTDYELRDLNQKAQRQEALGIRSESAGPQGEGQTGARYYPDDAIVDPRDILKAVEGILRTSANVTIREHTPAVDMPPGLVVLAAGAWTSALHPGIRESHPVKGHLIGYRLRPGTVPHILRHGHTYILQRSSGFTVAGSTTERAGFDTTVDPNIVASLHGRARRYLPELLLSSPDESWTGLRPAVEGDEPQVERLGDSDIWLAYGHYRNGILLAPITAAILAESMCGGPR